jgi:hypothetical protein
LLSNVDDYSDDIKNNFKRIINKSIEYIHYFNIDIENSKTLNNILLPSNQNYNTEQIYKLIKSIQNYFIYFISNNKKYFPLLNSILDSIIIQYLNSKCILKKRGKYIIYK